MIGANDRRKRHGALSALIGPDREVIDNQKKGSILFRSNLVAIGVTASLTATSSSREKEVKECTRKQ